MIDPIKDKQVSGEASASEPVPIKAFRRDGWFNVWGLMLAVFAGLLSACVYWTVRLGFWGALGNSQFGYEAFFAVVLGICLAARWSVPYLLLRGPSMDPRNAALMRMWRSGWYFRRRRIPPRVEPTETRGDGPVR